MGNRYNSRHSSGGFWGRSGRRFPTDTDEWHIEVSDGCPGGPLSRRPGGYRSQRSGGPGKRLGGALRARAGLGRLTRGRLAAAAGGTAGILVIGGFCLYGGGTAPEDPVAASVTAGPRSVGLGATMEDWKGSGLTATALNPAKFAPGACMAFAPQGTESRGKTVFLDAGHGGMDPGGTGTTTSGASVGESAVNLSVVMDAMKILTGNGYRVVVSRTAQTTVLRLGAGDTNGRLLSVKGAQDDIAARDACANLAHADLLAGVYMNAGSANEAGSVTTYDAVRPFARDSQRFANLLQSDVLARLNATGAGIPDGGVLSDTSMGSTLSSTGASYGHLMLLGPAYPPGGFTNPSRMPGALIEPLFLSDPAEATIADSFRGQHLVAAGLAQAVESYFASASSGS